MKHHYLERYLSTGYDILYLISSRSKLNPRGEEHEERERKREA